MANTARGRGLRILAVAAVAVVSAAAQTGLQPAPIVIDYPIDHSIVPPEITPPTFLWRDPADAATEWLIDVVFADGSPAIHANSKG